MSNNLKQFDQTILLNYIRSESAYDGKENELLERIADHIEDLKEDMKGEIMHEIKEICICSAIQYKSEKKELIIKGHRHCDCLGNMHGRPDKYDYVEIEQGFMTSKNRFVGRVEALKLQKKAGIKSNDPDELSGDYKYGILYSECLY